VIPIATRNGLDPPSFLIRRLFRIYPMYLVTLALMALAGLLQFLPRFAFIAQASPFEWCANILVLAEYVGARPFLGVSWTLAVELFWYVLFAASFVAFGNRSADRLDVAVPASLVLMALLSLAIGTRIPLGRPMMIYAAVIGFQCFRFHTGEIGARRIARSIGVFACTVLLSTYVAFGVFAHPNLTLGQAMGPWIAGTIIFLGWTLVRPFREARVFNAGLLPALGAMSYSIYLLHSIAAATANRYVVEALQVPTAVTLAVVLSWLGYKFVERPGIALGRIVAGRAARRLKPGQV
jgi:peptidoglycan/LPS O-acetylase OafA/YrhL